MNIRKALSTTLMFTSIAAVGMVIALGIERKLGMFWLTISKKEVMTPLLLAVISGGGVAVFTIMFIHHSIHEDTLWIRTVELVVPLCTAVYAVWSIAMGVRRR